MISFVYGIPDPSLLPVGALAEHAAAIVKDGDHASLAYADGLGTELSHTISRYLQREQGLAVEGDNLLITAGSSRGLEILFDLLVDRADVVLVDAPAWLGTIEILRYLDAMVVEIPVDADGIQTDAIGAALDRLERDGRRPRCLYTVPTFHNPMGVELSLERRYALAEIARRRQLLVIEDEAYLDLRFAGQRLPSMLELLGPERVVFFGTLSKVIGPGLRLGYCTGPRRLIRAMATAGPSATMLNSYTANLAKRFIESPGFAPHLANLRQVYGTRCQAMLAALEREMPSSVEWTRPRGGFFLWLTLPEALDAAGLRRRCQAALVDFLPGSTGFIDGGGERCLRLAFSTIDEEAIDEGIARLAAVIRSEIADGATHP